MPDSKTYAVGETLHIGTEAQHRQDHRDGYVSYTLDEEGRMVKPPYFPIHKGQKGSDPRFSDNAPHVATCTAVDDDGTTHMRCTCGLTWSFNHSKGNI